MATPREKILQAKQFKAQRVAAGLCSRCGIEPLHTATLCDGCAEKARTHAATLKAKREATGVSNAVLTERKLRGVCIDCGSAGPMKTKRRCVACGAKPSVSDGWAANRQAKGRTLVPAKDWAAHGLCMGCGGTRDRDATTCTSCAERRSATLQVQRREVRAQRFAEGRCLTCDNARTSTSPFCQLHLDAKREANRIEMTARNLERRAKGVCSACTEPVWEGRALCKYHSVKSSLAACCESGPKLAELSLAVAAKYDGICAYTGAPLGGDNKPNIEHVYPVSLFPELMAEPSNLVWVGVDVNAAKDNIPPDSPRLDAFMRPDVVARIRTLASQVKRACTDTPNPQNPTP